MEVLSHWNLQLWHFELSGDIGIIGSCQVLSSSAQSWVADVPLGGAHMGIDVRPREPWSFRAPKLTCSQPCKTMYKHYTLYTFLIFYVLQFYDLLYSMLWAIVLAMSLKQGMVVCCLLSSLCVSLGF